MGSYFQPLNITVNTFSAFCRMMIYRYKCLCSESLSFSAEKTFTEFWFMWASSQRIGFGQACL